MKRTILIAITVMALVFGLVAYAVALDASTAVNANVNTILELTAPPSVSLGSLDPDVDSSNTVALSGKSNKAATLSASVNVGNFTALGCDLEVAQSGLRGGAISVTDNVTGMVDWNVDGGTALAGTITYTLAQ
ncbi:MAG: hypothetical protein CVT66_04750 [Actinobacteria bacterium HGW-Actinobacteria-6]|nr:MAG: hypothetical protein CVT66_04750 [Actinobacteria bacterium HGW-Actinobacteria-6]